MFVFQKHIHMNLKEYFHNNICNISDIADAIDHANKHEINFFAFRFPNEIIGYFGASLLVSYDINTTGFLISPFQESDKKKKIIIPNDYNNNLPPNIPIKQPKDDSKSDISTNKDYYLQTTQKLIDELKTKEIDNKVVISKIIVNESDIDIATLFKTLCSTYQKAFIFCYYTSETGLWIGASPEQLICVDEKSISSMSLAGTRKANIEEEWSAKNIQEQKIVTDYISSIFRKHGYNPIVSERFTKNAGPVEHLCSIITSNTVKSSTSFFEMLEDLSPTPALAGYPKNYAIEKISSIELHDRRCYGGYIGPISSNENLSFFVNLRSINVMDSHYILFTGGGITKNSIAQEEWEETEIKALTLLNLINK